MGFCNNHYPALLLLPEGTAVLLLLLPRKKHRTLPLLCPYGGRSPCPKRSRYESKLQPIGDGSKAKLEIKKSPQVGFEPTTNRLTADRSTTELLKNLCLNFSIC